MSNSVGNYLSNPTIIIVAAVIILFAFVVVLVWDRKAREVLPTVKHFCSGYEQFKNRYIDHDLYQYAVNKYQSIDDSLKNATWFIKRRKEVRYFKTCFHELKDEVDRINEAYIAKTMKEREVFFSSVDGKRLDEQQQRAVITDETRELIIAGAGSGKTLTIVGKIAYLVKYQGIAPDEILLLAFNKKAADELTTRLVKMDVKGIEGRTFHSFGYGVIQKASKNRPKVEDEMFLAEVIDDYTSNNMLKDPSACRDMLLFMGLYQFPLSDEDRYDSIGEYYNHEKGRDFESLRSKYIRGKQSDIQSFKSEQMRSIEETIIANFLFLHGIEYEYESEYPYPDEAGYRRYHPDFYLPEYGLYLEHFGIDRHGNVPWLSAIEEQKYKADMEWKRAHHKKHGTKLIESYSYWKKEGAFLECLKSLLIENGVVFRRIDNKEILRYILADEKSQSVAKTESFKLIQTFIRLYKENAGISYEELRKKIALETNNYERNRESYLLTIIERVFNEYENRLKKKGTIDFSDMIRQSTVAIERGLCRTHYKYVIVDEFQDISFGRAKLLQAICNQSHAKLFCVGDDWQSIYRFAGCEVDYLTNFEKHFGYSKVLKVEHTYRNSQELVDAASTFIMMNPNQIKKKLVSGIHEEKPVRIFRYPKDSKSVALAKVVEQIAHDYGRRSRILLLMRNRFDTQFLEDDPDVWDTHGSYQGLSPIVYRPIPSLYIYSSTVHSAKGAEEDNVIIINGENSIHGFPNKMQDDPMLKLVLANPESFEYAEERRLFYVALTRTKHRTYILAPTESESVFVTELRDNNSKSLVTRYEMISETKQVKQKCPRCTTGLLVLRKNESTGDLFVGCTNYPQCTNTYKQLSILGNSVQKCRCGGFMVLRTGSRGNFMGCTNYPACTNTKQIPDRGDIYYQPESALR